MKLIDLIPIQPIEIDMASKTPKKDENEDGFNPDDTTSPNPTTPRSLPEKQIDVVLKMVSKNDGEIDDKYRCRQAFVKQQFALHGTYTSSVTDYFIQIAAKRSCHHPVLNQVSPQKESSVYLAQLKDPNFQRLIHIIREVELPPNHVNFESKIF